jgi:hypothetical protein
MALTVTGEALPASLKSWVCVYCYNENERTL